MFQLFYFFELSFKMSTHICLFKTNQFKKIPNVCNICKQLVQFIRLFICSSFKVSVITY